MEADVFVNYLVKASAEGLFDFRTFDTERKSEWIRARFAADQYLRKEREKVRFANFLFSLVGYLGSIVNLHKDSKPAHARAVEAVNKDYLKLVEAITGEKQKKTSKRDTVLTPEIQYAINLYNKIFGTQNK